MNMLMLPDRLTRQRGRFPALPDFLAPGSNFAVLSSIPKSDFFAKECEMFSQVYGYSK